MVGAAPVAEVLRAVVELQGDPSQAPVGGVSGAQLGVISVELPAEPSEEHLSPEDVEDSEAPPPEEDL